MKKIGLYVLLILLGSIIGVSWSTGKLNAILGKTVSTEGNLKTGKQSI